MAMIIQRVTLFLSAVLMSLMALAGYACKGTVVDIDTNEPLAGVRVTDGIHVATTDENGRFSLKGWGNSSFVTVTMPAGYSSQEFYIPFERNKESYDFKLKKDPRTAEAEHTFVQISDSEINASGAGEWLDHVKRTAEEENAAFVVHTGDICYPDGLKQHIKDMNADTMGRPVHYTIGNHDYVDGDYGEQLFESIYGPVWYSFDVGNTHYVMLPHQVGGDYGSKYLPIDRWRWLKNDLDNTDPDKKVVIFNHNKPPKGHRVWAGTEFLNLAERNVIAWIYGHYHQNDIQIKDGVLDISTGRPDGGGIDQSVAGTRICRIGENGYLTTEMRYYDFKEEEAAKPENALWTKQLNGNVLFTNTVLHDGKIYTATVDEGFPRKCGIYCINPESGKVVWYHPTLNSVKNNLLIVNGNVITQDAAGNVYCLNAKTGLPKWQAKVDLYYSYNINTSSGITTDGETVFAGGPSNISAFDVKTGKLKWSKKNLNGEPNAAEFVVKDDVLLVSSNWVALIALDKNTGKELWRAKDGEIRYRSSTPLVTDDGRIIVASSDTVDVLSLKTGEVISSVKLPGYSFDTSAQPILNGNIAYIPTIYQGVIAFNLDAQKVEWTAHTENSLIGTSPYIGHTQSVENLIMHGGKLVFAASDGNLYTVNSENGEILTKQNVGAPVLNNVAVYEDSYIVCDFAGRVSRIK